MEQVQEHLSKEGTYLMGDTQVRGFPIRYASPGFERTYGYSGADIVMKKCGEVFGPPSIASRTYALAQLAHSTGLSLRETDARLKFLTGKAAEACRVMMASPGSRVGVAILANRKKNGTIFVCECLLLCLKHPSLNWSYSIGFQRDITQEVALSSLMRAAASDEAYAAFLASRGPELDARRRTLLGVGSENVVKCLHEKAMDVFSLDIWRSIRKDMHLSPEATPHVSAAASASSSTAAHKQERVSSPASSAHYRALASASSSALQRTSRPPVSLFPSAQASAQQAVAPYAAPSTLMQAHDEPVSLYNVPMNIEACEEMISFLSNMGLRAFAEPLLRVGFDDMDTLQDITEDDMRDFGLPRGYAVKLKKKLTNFKGTAQLADMDRRSEVSVQTAQTVDEETQKTTVQRSWEKIQEVGVEKFGEALFQELFRLEPATTQLFTAEVCDKYWDWSMDSGAVSARARAEEAGLPSAPQLWSKVVNVIGGAIVGLHDARTLVPNLVRFGARHAAYGVTPEHLELLGRALPAALREVLGEEALTSEVELAWSVVYNFISASMIGGMHAAASLAQGSPMSRQRPTPPETSEGAAPSDKAQPSQPLDAVGEARQGGA